MESTIKAEVTFSYDFVPSGILLRQVIRLRDKTYLLPFLPEQVSSIPVEEVTGEESGVLLYTLMSILETKDAFMF